MAKLDDPEYFGGGKLETAQISPGVSWQDFEEPEYGTPNGALNTAIDGVQRKSDDKERQKSSPTA